MDEKKKILEMISEGKISPEEGMKLLNALGENKEEFVIKKKIYKTLKVKVEVENEEVKVNLSIPLSLIKVASGFTKFIPEDAMNNIEKGGVNLKDIEEIENGELDDPTICDVDINNKDDGKVIVKIYVD
ncbi:SHOCT-like domain-containing protein [Clostridium perfringens]|uniref:SHOCT-like domain-containing protein n=1 Tax=Clostridium perfringens TaxID=1502 RepID=UPI0039ECA5D0